MNIFTIYRFFFLFVLFFVAFWSLSPSPSFAIWSGSSSQMDLRFGLNLKTPSFLDSSDSDASALLLVSTTLLPPLDAMCDGR